jgi:hypothetical protein
LVFKQDSLLLELAAKFPRRLTFLPLCTPHHGLAVEAQARGDGGMMALLTLSCAGAQKVTAHPPHLCLPCPPRQPGAYPAILGAPALVLPGHSLGISSSGLPCSTLNGGESPGYGPPSHLQGPPECIAYGSMSVAWRGVAGQV